MLRLGGLRGLRASASLAGRYYAVTRGLASGAAPHTTARSVPALLSAAAKTSPLKDAAKFYVEMSTPDNTILPADSGIPLKGVKLWTYRDVDKHARALANGLVASGFSAGDKIVACLPSGSPEYLTLLLAAANTGVSIVAVAAPANSLAVDVGTIRSALTSHKPKGLIVWHGYKVPESEEAAEDGSVIGTLMPTLASDHARSTSGFTKLTGAPVSSSEFPSLMHVIHTGDAHVRGAIAYKSLLVYSDEPVSEGAGRAPVLIEASTGRELTQSALLSDAKAMGEKLKLISDPYAKNGKLVVRPESSPEAATASLSALMYEALLISPGAVTDSARGSTTAELENALVA